MRLDGRLWQAVLVVTTIVGEVERVTFESEESSFRVIRLGKVSGLEQQTKTTAVGIMQAVGVGTQVRVSGHLETDPRHGERFRVQSLVLVAPDTLEGIEKYLSSGVVRGIGPGFAKRIVNYFGLECLRVLDDQPHRLAEVPGLGKARIKQIRESWIEQSAMSNVLLALGAQGASPSLAARIIQRFGIKAAEVVEQTPYRLAIYVSGVGFRTADKIARQKGLPLDHPERAQAGILHVLRSLADSGNCLSHRDSLVARSAEMLEVSNEVVESALDTLWAEEIVVIEDDAVFLQKLHWAEEQVATRIAALMAAPSTAVGEPSSLIEKYELFHGIELAAAQKAAVSCAAAQKFLVVTGGPGVGKTTLVRAILSVFSEKNLRIHLAAPTGRAAKRLSDSTGHRASTLHRLLEVQGKGEKFARHAENPLETDLLIVDEASMVDVRLAAHLLCAIPDAARVVFVGDVDQLPSVGPGAFLKDLIDSRSVPVARLDVVFRQEGQSGIIENAHRILRGEKPESSKEASGDFFIIDSSSPHRVLEIVRQVVCERIPKRFGLDSREDVQVLVPMHRGTVGTIALNELLQGALNADGESLKRDHDQLKVGDKVLQTKNNYDKDVFNGDRGIIFQVQSEPRMVIVRFEGDDDHARLVTYDKTETLELALCYATSIHKSQGSEYPAVVIPLLSSHFIMLSRNLLYTAVTRAKQLCVLIADDKTLSIALNETRKESRLTGLAQRIASACGAPATESEISSSS